MCMVFHTGLTGGADPGHAARVTCDHCKADILRGESYSITEQGRLHSRCLRARTEGSRELVLGPYAPGTQRHLDPLYCLRA